MNPIDTKGTTKDSVVNSQLFLLIRRNFQMRTENFLIVGDLDISGNWKIAENYLEIKQNIDIAKIQGRAEQSGLNLE